MAPTLLEVAQQKYRYQSALIDELVRRATILWRQMYPHDLDRSWQIVGPRLVMLIAAGQLAAASAADNYIDAALQAEGVPLTTTAAVSASALSGVASDGRTLPGLLLSAPMMVRLQSSVGTPIEQAMLAGLAVLRMHVATQVADAGRIADRIATVTRPSAQFWVRMIEPGACSRCAVLAGKVFRWKADFDRHPGCRCIAIPQSEALDDLTTNPNLYFDSLTAADQDRIFTRAGAEAIRHGADISQVVNARRGMSTAQPAAMRESWATGRLQLVDVFGRPTALTREGVTRRGVAGKRLAGRNGGIRLMPESIFRVATTRDEAVRLLTQYGYIL